MAASAASAALARGGPPCRRLQKEVWPVACNLGLPGADHRGRRVRSRGSCVQVAEHEHGPPEQDEAEDLVRAYADAEERPVEDDGRRRKGQLGERRVGGSGAAKAPVVEQQADRKSVV